MYGNLVEQAGRLAASYRTIGYRGVLCVDAVVTSDTDVVLTEVNARTTTSTHLHTVLAANLRKIVQGDSVTISQHHAPAHWPPLSTDQFLGELKRLDLAYDPNTGGGVVMTTPSKTEEGSHSLMFAVLGTPGNQPEYLERLGRLAAVPRDLAAPPAIRASS